MCLQVPLLGFIGRLDYQKGADLVLGAAHSLLNQDVQLICLGTGDAHLEVGTESSCSNSSCQMRVKILSAGCPLQQLVLQHTMFASPEVPFIICQMAAADKTG